MQQINMLARSECCQTPVRCGFLVEADIKEKLTLTNAVVWLQLAAKNHRVALSLLPPAPVGQVGESEGKKAKLMG